MTRITTAQNSFASGEIDPRLIGQIDIKSYAQGLKRMRNFARLSTGGIERRFGTFDLASLSGASRLADFEFSDTQRYVFAFQDSTLEIFSMDGALLTTLTGCPWTSANIFELNYTQLGDVMIVCHQDFWPQKVTRTGAFSFTLADFAFDRDTSGNKVYQPYFKFENPEVTLSASATTGSITLTANPGFFTSDYVGSRIRFQGVEIEITAYTNATTVTGTVKGTLKVKLSIDPFKTKNGSSTVEVQHLYHGYATGASVTFSGVNDVGGVTAANINGARTITVVDEHTYTFTAGGSATSSEDGGGTNVEISVAGQAIRDWLEPIISDVRGYPGACCFHEGRLWLGGTSQFPDGYWSSKALQYFNFDVGTGLDGDSVQGAAGIEDMSRIRHIVSNGELQILTPLRELVFVTPDGVSITPTNQRVKAQSIAGCSGVMPVIFDGATLFVQENGLAVSEMSYSSEQGGYLAVPVSTLAGHLISNPVDMASSPGVVSRAEQYAYIVNDDGSCAVFHSLRVENLAGWGLWTLGAGDIKSVTAIGPYVYFAVYVRGSYRLYRLSNEQAMMVDGGVYQSSATPKSTWTLAASVRGRTVDVCSNKGYHGQIAVPSNGVITLGVNVSEVCAGDGFYALAETLPPVVDLPSGTRVRLIRRLVRSVIEFYNTWTASVDEQRVITLDDGEDWEDAIDTLYQPIEVHHLGFSRMPTTVITQTEPLPMTVLALTQEVKV